MVEDEGPGIDADELPHVRQRFYRGRRRSPVGSGLGLAIVREVANIYDGTVTAMESEDMGGLLVRLRLPEADSAP